MVFSLKGLNVPGCTVQARGIQGLGGLCLFLLGRPFVYLIKSFFFLFKYFIDNDYCGCLCMCAYVNMGTHGAMARVWSGAPLFWDSACFFTLFLRQDLYAPGRWPASFQTFLLSPLELWG